MKFKQKICIRKGSVFSTPERIAEAFVLFSAPCPFGIPPAYIEVGEIEVDVSDEIMRELVNEKEYAKIISEIAEHQMAICELRAELKEKGSKEQTA